MTRSLLHQQGLAEGRHPTTGVAFDAVHHVSNTINTKEITMDDQQTQDQLDGGALADDPTFAGEPAREPSSPAPDDASRGIAEPAGVLRIPQDTRGHYVVLWARKPAKGDQMRPHYREAICVEANDTAHAKRRALGHNSEPADPVIADFLKRSAAQKPGILLRAVPAMHWPATVDATTYDRPAPILQIG